MRFEWWELDGFLWAGIIVVVVIVLIKLVVELALSVLGLYVLWRLFDWLAGLV